MRSRRRRREWSGPPPGPPSKTEIRVLFSLLTICIVGLPFSIHACLKDQERRHQQWLLHSEEVRSRGCHLETNCYPTGPTMQCDEREVCP